MKLEFVRKQWPRRCRMYLHCEVIHIKDNCLHASVYAPSFVYLRSGYNNTVLKKSDTLVYSQCRKKEFTCQKSINSSRNKDKINLASRILILDPTKHSIHYFEVSSTGITIMTCTRTAHGTLKWKILLGDAHAAAPLQSLRLRLEEHVVTAMTLLDDPRR